MAGEETLVCGGCAREYPVRSGIPRFVPAENYAGNFGFQWNRFAATQLDSRSGHAISRERFVDHMGTIKDKLRGARVLDAGCGAGRFAEIALSLGARLTAIDYSSAVEATAANLLPNESLQVVQADIFRLPFAEGSFDVIYSLGVLQHTPDPRRAIHALIPLLAPGGVLVVDIYRRPLGGWLDPKYWLRLITTRMDQQRLFTLIERTTPAMLRASRALSRIPLIGKYARRIVPVANYEGIYPLSEQQLHEWAVLDTFDWFGPRYDLPQTASTLRRWLEEGGLVNIEVASVRGLTGRGTRPR
jgi:2-polyprenyl-3-methyl-5-hydroxy-6-metoxy-1,4-benzoquinol methylase